MEGNELIQGCISGDKKCWDQFVNQYSRLIYDSIIRTFKKYGIDINNDIIDDLHNDVFVLLLKDQYKAFRDFEGRNGCSVASYVRTISVRKTIDYLRRQRPTVSIDTEIDTDEGKKFQFIKELIVFDDSSLLEKEDAEKIVNLLFSNLEDDERQFCQLYFIENKTPEEIACAVHISVDNVYVRKQRILEKLQKIAKEQKIC